MEEITVGERNKAAAIYGVLLGVIFMILTTCSNLMVGSFMGFYVAQAVVFILYFILLGIFAGRIRKANGGYIEFRKIFGAVIVMVFISCLISYLYNLVYQRYIDPGFMEKVKNGTVQFMEQRKLPDDQIDEAVKKIDKQIAESKNTSIGAVILTYFELCLFYCLLGLIVAAIVKKNRPVFDILK